MEQKVGIKNISAAQFIKTNHLKTDDKNKQKQPRLI